MGAWSDQPLRVGSNARLGLGTIDVMEEAIVGRNDRDSSVSHSSDGEFGLGRMGLDGTYSVEHAKYPEKGCISGFMHCADN